MEAQSPVDGHVRRADHLHVLLDDLVGRRADEEVKVEDAANDLVGQGVGAHDNVHAIAVEQEHTVGVAVGEHLHSHKAHAQRSRL